MLLGSRKTTEERIVEHLAQAGGSTAASIREHLCQHKEITKQSVYEQLRKLIAEGVLFKTKGEYFLDSDWLESLREMVNSIQAPRLDEGESTTYSFKSLQQLNTYWKYLFIFFSSENPDMPICAYDTYPFWEHLVPEKENEVKYDRLFRARKHKVFFLIGDGGKHSLDFKKRNTDEFYRVNCIDEKRPGVRNFYVIFGNIIVTSIVPKEFAAALGRLYSSSISAQELKDGVLAEIAHVTKATLRIERNKQKAAKLRALILRDFALSEQERKSLL